MPITDFHAYGKLIYSLQKHYASIRRSTLVLATIGPTLAKLQGQVIFANDVVMDGSLLTLRLDKFASTAMESTRLL